MTKLAGSGNDEHPAWSPKDDRIAFVSSKDDRASVCVMSADGSSVERLTSGTAKDFNPAWSKDGTEIVFYREKGDGMDQIWAVKADGSSERQVTNDEANNVFPSFTSDGRIAYSSNPKGGMARVVTVSTDGENARVAEGVVGFYARWSPDGKKVAFIAGRWPKSAIYVLDLKSGDLKKIVN